jgi:DNA-binding CsgD family transcriptional regulator
MISLEALSELLEVLYSAPLQLEQWERFLALLSEHTGSECSVLLCANSRLALSVGAQGGRGQFDQAAYNERYAANDPLRAPIIRHARTGVFHGNDLLPNGGMQRTDLYRNLLAPVGYRYTTHMVLAVNVRRLEVITVARTLNQGAMPPECSRLLNLLVPHLQKALEIRQVLGVAQQRLAGAEAMADASATATFLLSRSGRVLHRNAAAEYLLSQADGLILHDGMLTAAEGRFKEPLRKLFHDAGVTVSPQWKTRLAHAFALHRCSGKQPLQLLASPLPPSHRNHAKADLVLLVTDPEKPVNFPDDVLRALYGLTPAQTEVANGLLTGYTLNEIARLRRVSVGTVRQQVKNIFTKTGATRQSDLVRLLMTLPPSASVI